MACTKSLAIHKVHFFFGGYHPEEGGSNLSAAKNIFARKLLLQKDWVFSEVSWLDSRN